MAVRHLHIARHGVADALGDLTDVGQRQSSLLGQRLASVPTHRGCAPLTGQLSTEQAKDRRLLVATPQPRLSIGAAALAGEVAAESSARPAKGRWPLGTSELGVERQNRRYRRVSKPCCARAS